MNIFPYMVVDPNTNISLSADEVYELTSPNYPLNYTVNLDLQWFIQVPVGYSLFIEILDFSTEKNFDVLSIRDSDAVINGPAFAAFSGTSDQLSLIFPVQRSKIET